MSFCTLVFPKFYVVPLRFLKFYFLPWRFRNFLLYPLVCEILSHALDILKFFTMPSLFRFYVWSACFLPCLYILFQYDLCALWRLWWPFSSSSSFLVLSMMVLLCLLSSSSSFLFSFSGFIFSWPPLFLFFLWWFFSVCCLPPPHSSFPSLLLSSLALLSPSIRWPWPLASSVHWLFVSLGRPTLSIGCSGP